IHAAFCAMAMQYIRLQFLNNTVDIDRGIEVARPDLALHRNAIKTKGQLRLQLFQYFIFARSAGTSIANDPNLMPLHCLKTGKITDMTEKSACWLSEAMNDAQRLVGCIFRHGQPSEQAFAHVNRVAWQNRIRNQHSPGHHFPVDLPRYVSPSLTGAGTGAARRSAGSLACPPRNMGMLSSRAHFTHHDHRAIAIDFTTTTAMA